MSPVITTTSSPFHPLSTATRHDLLAGAPWRRLVVMGDSVAAGVGDPTPGFPDRSWAEQLAGALERTAGSVSYLNLGVRGLKAAEILDTQLPPALEHRPDLVVVSSGGNDILGRRFDPAQVEDLLDATLSPLASTGALLVTFSLFDLASTPFVPDEMRAGLRHRLEVLAEITERLTSDLGGVHVDYLGDPRSSDPTIYSADQLHANRRGHAFVLDKMVEGLGAWLGNVGDPTASRSSILEVSGAPPGA
jgi:lysophospholipase L1-like esterase